VGWSLLLIHNEDQDQRDFRKAALPEYAHGPAEDAYMDLRAVDRDAGSIPLAVPTGLTIELPPGYEVRLQRLALKHAITVPTRRRPSTRLSRRDGW
jgi:dUTPase